MPTYRLEETRRRPTTPVPGFDGADLDLPGGQVGVEAAEQEQVAASWEQGVIEAVRREVDNYLLTLKQLSRMEPDQVFLFLSGLSARLAEIRIQLVRSPNRRLQALRTKEVDPLIEEIDRQYKLISRVQAVRDFDLKLAGGQV